MAGRIRNKEGPEMQSRAIGETPVSPEPLHTVRIRLLFNHAKTRLVGGILHGGLDRIRTGDPLRDREVL